MHKSHDGESRKLPTLPGVDIDANDSSKASPLLCCIPRNMFEAYIQTYHYWNCAYAYDYLLH